MSAVEVRCSTCDGYQLIDDGSGHLTGCPDCHAAVRCPIHKQLVPARDGTLMARCWRCSEEAAAGEKWLRAHPIRRRVA